MNAAVDAIAGAMLLRITELRLPLDHAPEALRRAVARYEGLRTRFTPPHDARWMHESDSALAYLPAGDPAYAVSAAAALAEFDFDYLTLARARLMPQPILVLWGEYDPVFPVEAGRAMAARLKSADFRVVGRSWHRPHEERPGETGRLMGEFLATLPREGPPSH